MTSFPELHTHHHGAVIGLAGLSGAGKTTLAEKLIAALVARGHEVSSVKHAHRGFEVDQEGKDSSRHRKAGTREMVLASDTDRVKFTRNREPGHPPRLDDILVDLTPVDFVLVEGFKKTAFPKIEIHRAAFATGFLYDKIPGVFLVASDTSLPDCPIPVIALDDIDAIADAIEAQRKGNAP